MTSDTAQKNSPAWKNLQFAMGKSRASLKGLTRKEFVDLLKQVLYEVDLREIRGFKKLSEDLSGSIGSFESRLGKDYPLQVSPDVKFEVVDFKTSDKEPKAPITLDSHFIRVSRRAHFFELTWRRYESGEETTYWDVMDGWGRGQGYLLRGQKHRLILRRPPNHTCAKDNLFEVRYLFEKVTNEDRYIITAIELEPIPVDMFRGYFGESHARVARDLISELTSIHFRTLGDLESQVNSMRRKVEEFRRFEGATME